MLRRHGVAPTVPRPPSAPLTRFFFFCFLRHTRARAHRPSLRRGALDPFLLRHRPSLGRWRARSVFAARLAEEPDDGHARAYLKRALNAELWARYQIEVPVFVFRDELAVRVSTPLYVTLSHLEHLENAILELLGEAPLSQPGQRSPRDHELADDNASHAVSSVFCI